MNQQNKKLQQFGELLNDVRTCQRITVREICQEVGISATTYSQV